MFSSIEKSGSVQIVKRNFSWGEDLTRIIRVVENHFEDFNGNGFYPHPQEEGLQRELLAIPTLRDLGEAIGSQNVRGVAITDLGLSHLSEAHRNAVLYAIALTRGFPTSTDQRTKRVAWDVRAKKVDPQTARFTTFSERVGSAEMHTDSSFYPMPEEQFLLYVVAAARCNGGESLLIDVNDIYQELQKTREGRIAYSLLTTREVPFRVPAVYAAGDDKVEYYLAPVFHHDGGLKIRWRYDSIMKGLATRPDLSSPELVDAVELVNEIVERDAPRFQRHLPDDTLLWADNHHTLHGRAVYTDPDRHLIRIRISNTPNARRIGPSGISAD
ncbi:TauD/TfdA family dioxygenase [Pseudoduganella sp. RAF19]|uniref:TauD/TfdA family dioxygenase n=2 Tax=unclassified Pseudoduganella TaxID=2637179 RepID=UPI003F97F088